MTNWSDLDKERVSALSAGQDQPTGFAIVWPNILWCAELFWQAQIAGDDARRLETWHHLVMAVGNFKRQGGTQICLLQAVPEGHAWLAQDRRPRSCKVQTVTGEIELIRDDPGSWELLAALKGVEVATATTLLSALWPRSHVIMDTRVLNATMGLNMAEAVEKGWLTTDSRKTIGVSWEMYAWVRSKVLEKTDQLNAEGANVEPVYVERSLYILDQRVRLPQKLSWNEYAEELGRVLTLLQRERHRND
jgi:hypothetical protein